MGVAPYNPFSVLNWKCSVLSTESVLVETTDMESLCAFATYSRDCAWLNTVSYTHLDVYKRQILSGCEINNFVGQPAQSVCYNLVAMFDLFRLWLGAVLRGFRTRRSLMLENLALRQQLAVFKRQQPRPRLGAIDKLFWVVARRFWAHWKKALLIVLPDTVARWHRSGFKLYYSE